MTSPLPVYPVVAAHGCELTLADGGQLVDGMSSWWAAIHGYNHPRLNAAMKAQIDQMSHVMFGGITHPSAVALCRQLVAMTPESLECVFLADSGSVAVEVAMKMALQYWQAKGEPRRRFLTFRNGYHGDTFGAMSVCDPTNSMHSLWQGYLPDNLFAPAPQSRFDGDWDERDMAPFARLMAAHRHEIAAVILEPILGESGVVVPPVDYLATARRITAERGALLILDEATSSVDTRTEMLVQEAMNRLRRGRTSFVIAHRLSTIRDADLILVMEHGNIVEQGSHSQLLERKGHYYELYQAQFDAASHE